MVTMRMKEDKEEVGEAETGDPADEADVVVVWAPREALVVKQQWWQETVGPSSLVLRQHRLLLPLH